MMRALTASLVFCAALPVAAVAAEKISPTAVARARASGDAAVIVALRAPAMPADVRALPARRAAIALLRAAVLGTLAPSDVRVERAYRTVAGFAGRVSAAGLERLAANPDVRTRRPRSGRRRGRGGRRGADPRRPRAGARRERHRRDDRGHRHRRRREPSRHRRRARARGVLLPRRPHREPPSPSLLPGRHGAAVRSGQRRVGRRAWSARCRHRAVARARRCQSASPRARSSSPSACSTTPTRASCPTGSPRSTGLPPSAATCA